MDILLDPSNKPAQQFLIYRKIQDGPRGSKVQNLPNLTSQITFRLGIWIWFIRFGHNLAWTYFLTLQTSLRKNFSFIAKSKMAAGGQRSKIDSTNHILALHLDPVHPIWTKFDMDILLDLLTNLTDKFLHKLVCRVKKYVYAKFCPNLINEIQMLNRNVISRVKVGRFWTFDPQRPSWILG